MLAGFVIASTSSSSKRLGCAVKATSPPLPSAMKRKAYRPPKQYPVIARAYLRPYLARIQRMVFSTLGSVTAGPWAARNSVALKLGSFKSAGAGSPSKRSGVIVMKPARAKLSESLQRLLVNPGQCNWIILVIYSLFSVRLMPKTSVR